MIIWGSRGRESTVSNGQFYCPRCQNYTPFKHQKVSRYFTLYFIPLFPIAKLGEYVRCGQCAGQFKPEILQYSAEQIQASSQPWRCAVCGNTNPPDQEHCLNCRAHKSAPPPAPPQFAPPPEATESAPPLSPDTPPQP